MASTTGTVPSMSDLIQAGANDLKAETKADPQLQDLDASKLRITQSTSLREVPEPNSEGVWGVKQCSDHMIKVIWTADHGWHAPEIVPYGPLTMMPTASCLHYATSCFEGMKVYRGFDGKLRLFRPDRNCGRLVTSSSRLALPAFDPVELEKLLKAFLGLDGPRWLPKSQPGNFLYIRPTIIGNGEELGVQVPAEVMLFVIAVPWPDLSTGQKPGAPPKAPGLKLLASKDDIRAWPGGFGYTKVSANYGPAFLSHMEGRKRGYDQILWLFGKDFQVTEAGASNFFVIWKNKEGKTELITAPLTDKIILDGVTRRSVLELAKERLSAGSKDLQAGIEPLDVVERTFSMLEVEEAWKEGRLVEAFVAGTAYFITPVSAVNFKDTEIEIPMSNGDSGKYTAMVKNWLYDIMYGKVQHPWGVIIEEKE
ncbi:branched-chain-amino-acid aminotransferase-2 [Coleophoma crateriformis]|uniref:Branched-chain-amino-acid aminotransferase n=1 Tax=Coleophoma crateriformis TaxID=565419 RepID=A0A3D8QQE5_9HELO|nr:branched-chain-amino-acid aminotransferase-2 [Coleophoma crateriformis]